MTRPRNRRGARHAAALLGRAVSLLLGGLLVGICVYDLNARCLLGDPLPMPFGYGMAVVLTGSMEPTIHPNDLLIVRRESDPEVGDVVVYQSGDVLITHRLIEKQNGYCITQGDANNVADDPVLPEQIKGVAVARVPGVGLAVRWLQNPVGLLCAAALLILPNEIAYRIEKARGKRELDKMRREIEKLRDHEGRN